MSSINSENIAFIGSHCVYTRAQALIWVANGLSMIDTFEVNAGNLLAHLLSECPEEKSLIVNFEGIGRLNDHSLDEVFKHLNNNRKQLIIKNCGKVKDQFHRFTPSTVNFNYDTEFKILIIGNNKTVDFVKLEEEKEELTTSYINQTLENTFEEFDDFQRLSSTPFLAKGEFDSKKIIHNPKHFMWFSLYLSDKLRELIEANKLINITLVSASLRGAIFVSVLGILNKINYINLDHIGPVNRIYDSTTLLKKNNCNYIYIGDFVFGGTEIKLTKAYLSLTGSELNHALVLGSLFDPTVFKDYFQLMQLKSLVEINRKAKYKLFP